MSQGNSLLHRAADIWRLWNQTLAEKMSQQGQDLGSQAVFLEAAVAEARQRDDPEYLWAALNGLCKINLSLKRVPQALALASEALELAEGLWGPDSSQAGTVLSDLMFIAALEGSAGQARRLSERLQRVVLEASAGGLDAAFSYNLTSLATFHAIQGGEERTEALLWQVIRRAEGQDRADPDILLFVYDNLINFYLAQDQRGKAEAARARALEVMQRAGYPQARGQDPGGGQEPTRLH